MAFSLPPHLQLCAGRSISTTILKPHQTHTNGINDAPAERFLQWPSKGTNEEKDYFMIQACNTLTPNENIVPDWARQDDTYVSAKTAPLGSDRIRFGMDEVCGCAVLFVKSQKRVYIAHYWENGIFGLNKGERRRKLDFDTQVIGFILNGYQPPNGPHQESLKMHAEDFKDDPNLIVEIFSPIAQRDERPWGATAGSTKNPLGLLYPAKVQRIAQTVSNILHFPLLKVNLNGYHAVDKEDLDDDEESSGDRLLKETAAGHVLFDYDPRGLGRGEQTWRLVWEREELFRG